MATRSGFFNSINNDRVYSANEFAEYFSAFIGNGIFPSPIDSFQVIPDEGLTIKVKAGKAWINGYYFVSDADIGYTLQSDPILPRIDRFVLRLHFSQRQITIERKQGLPGSIPSTPELIRDAEMFELSLATILIQAAANIITTAMINDTRSNLNECGFVASTITNIPTMSSNRALIANGNGELDVSTITSNELLNLSGVTSNIQNQLNTKQTSISGGASTIATNNLTASRVLQSDGSGKVAVSSITTTELGTLSGVTSAIQTQLNNKQALLNGAATTIASSDLAVNRVLASNASGKVSASSVTTSELGYVSGVTSAIQTQLNSKLASSAQASDSLKIGGKKIHVGTSAPSSPAVGDLWIDTN